MVLPLTEDQRLLRDAARDFAGSYVAPRAAERDETATFPTDELRVAAGIGLLGLAIPEELGGTPVDAVTTALVYEELSRASAALSVILSVHNSLTSAAVARFGTPTLQTSVLPGLASGERIGSYALTEANAGSDAAAIATRAVRSGDDFYLSGRKQFVTSAGHAGLFVVFAVTDPDARTANRITAFAVPRDAPGLSVGKEERKLGLHASEINELVLDECRVPATNLLGEVGGGFGIAMDLLNAGRIGIAAQAVGIAQAALDASLEYAHSRQQFGQPISEFQGIQWKLADMAARIEAARLLVWQAARLKDMNEPFARQASQAKLFASELAVQAASEAVQIHGGYGYMRDFGVERLYRDAKATELYEGTSEIQRLVIARSLLSEETR